MLPIFKKLELVAQHFVDCYFVQELTLPHSKYDTSDRLHKQDIDKVALQLQIFIVKKLRILKH